MRADERVESATVVVARRLIAGSVIVVVAGFAAVVLSPSAEPVGRVLVMAIASGVLAAFVTDWRACLGVMATSMAVFVGFLGTNRVSSPAIPGPGRTRRSLSWRQCWASATAG